MKEVFNIHDISRDAFMLHGPLARHGYDWWWHSLTAQDAETGEGIIKLYDKIDGKLVPVDEVEASHIGCEYGEYDM